MREKIEEIEVELTPKRSFLKVSAVVCNVKPVRELEQAYKDKCNQLDMAFEVMTDVLEETGNRNLALYLAKLKDNQDGE